MAVYRLPVTVRPPGPDTEDKYLAEIPVLPGCRAWGDTLSDALMYVQSVAVAFIESYRERGEALPDLLTPMKDESPTVVIQSELLVSA
jgi:predicted RNase H-like HicB family nuclease